MIGDKAAPGGALVGTPDNGKINNGNGLDSPTAVVVHATCIFCGIFTSDRGRACKNCRRTERHRQDDELDLADRYVRELDKLSDALDRCGRSDEVISIYPDQLDLVKRVQPGQLAGDYWRTHPLTLREGDSWT